MRQQIMLQFWQQGLYNAALAKMAWAEEQRCQELAEHPGAPATLAPFTQDTILDLITTLQHKMMLTQKQIALTLNLLAASLARKASAKEQGCRESADCTATLADLTLAKEQRCHAAAEQAAVLAERLLTDKQCCHEAAERTMALVDNKQCQVDANAAQSLAAADHAAVLVEPPSGNAAIEHIWMEFALCIAPLDAILSEIAWEETAYTALAPLMTPLAHPATILSSSLYPTSYVGVVLATMGGGMPLAIPLPTISSQLQIVRQCTEPCHCTGRCNCP